MALTKLERELLDLPEAERAALVSMVIRSLSEEERLAVWQEMGLSQNAILRGLGEHLKSIMEGWFEGPTEPLTDQLWSEILNATEEEGDTESPAVPPGWRPAAARSK